jgi:hypothetical protein
MKKITEWKTEKGIEWKPISLRKEINRQNKKEVKGSDPESPRKTHQEQEVLKCMTHSHKRICDENPK